MTKLSLRFRIFLFFCLLAAGGVGLAAAAMLFGYTRGPEGAPTMPFVTAFIAFAFLNSGLVLGVWLLFDEHVAKPINKLSAGLRLRAHSGISGNVSPDAARYLGDLAPAAKALSQSVDMAAGDTAAKVATETQRLRAQRERLTEVLSAIPVATILLNGEKQIVLYDSQAAAIISEIAPPRLKAPLTDYFAEGTVAAAMSQLAQSGGGEAVLTLISIRGGTRLDARMKQLGDDGHMIFVDTAERELQPTESRPLVFDFDLMETVETKAITETPLSDLTFVPFDTETTGLSVEKDDIVQIGAVRVLKGRIVEGEVIDTYVNPGRPIPPASTLIHHVTDDDVAEAPDIATAGRSLHDFARDSVLVAHNAPFDIGLLRKFGPKMGVEWSHPVLDTVLLSAVVFGTTEDHSLDALCERLSITIASELRHTALGDARATADALVKLLPLLKGKGIDTFGDLIAETRKHGRLLQDLNT